MTVHQIAKLAKVSTATVSRVLNNPETVKPETAEAVRRVIAQHGGDKKNVIRRGPRQGRRTTKPRDAHTIAIVSINQPHGPWFQLPVISRVVAGISRGAREHGLVLQIEEAHSVEELETTLPARGVGGALTFLPADTSPQVLRDLARIIPVVRVMGEATESLGVDHVCPDNVAIGAMAFDYLISRGCRDVAFMTSHPAWDLVYVRHFGFQTRALNAGMPEAPPAYVVSQHAPDVQRYGARVTVQPTLEELVDAFATASPRPAALFVPRDEEVVPIYRLLTACGVRPGRDVTIISCDNEEMRLSGLDPRPASIELGTMEIGRWAVRRLISRIRRPQEPAVKIAIAPRLALPDAAGAASAESIASNPTVAD